MLKEEVPGLYESYRARINQDTLVYWHGADGYLGIVNEKRKVGLYFNTDAAKDLLQSIKDALESQPEGE
jgi:hypothetical protein